MSAPSGGPYDEGSRGLASHGQTSLTLPPIRSLDLQLTRPEESKGSDSISHPGHSAQTGQPGQTYSPLPTTSRRESNGLQWRPYATQDVSQAGSTGQPVLGPPREAPPPPFGRPYVADSTYSSSFPRDEQNQQQHPHPQFRTFSNQTSMAEQHEASNLADSRGSARRGEAPFQSASPYPSDLYGGSPEAQTSRPARSSSMMEPRQEYRGQVPTPSTISYSSPTTSTFPPPPPTFGSQTPSFSLSRPSFSAPSHSPSSPLTQYHQPSSHRDDSGTNTTPSSTGASHYAHQSFAGPTAPSSNGSAQFLPRSWPDRSLHYGGLSESAGPSRFPSSGARRSVTERWGTSGADGGATHPATPRGFSSDFSHSPRHRMSPPIYTRPHDVVELSSSISEIVNHCMALTQFAKHYAEKQAQGRDGPEDQPSSVEVQQMVHRATAVAQLLDSLRLARLNEEGLATQHSAMSSIGSKRSWDTSQGASPARPLKLIFESGQSQRSASEPLMTVPQPAPAQPQPEKSPDGRPTKAQEDLELIKRKRHAATGTPLDPPPPAPKAKKRGPRTKNASNSMPGQCTSCGSRETPEWRRGPEGPRTLCNACGLHYAKESRENQAAQEAAKRAVGGHETVTSTASASLERSGRPSQGDSRGGSHSHGASSSTSLPTGPSPSTRLAQATSPVRLSYPGFVGSTAPSSFWLVPA